jgi:hypothetical protein
MRRLLLAGCAGFLVALIWTLPLRWIAKALPDGIVCTEPGGSAWHGHCAELRAAGTAWGAASWRIHPAGLLLGSLVADVRVASPTLTCSGELTLRPAARRAARDMNCALLLGVANVLPGIPPDARGRIEAQLASIELKGNVITGVRGRLLANDVTLGGAPPVSYGDYELLFERAPAADGGIPGRLHDQGGPLAVEATLVLTPAPGYLLNGTVAPRAGAAPELLRQLALLGPADAAGARSFAQEATF